MRIGDPEEGNAVVMMRASESGATATAPATAPARRVEVPLADLKAQYRPLKDEILTSLAEVAESTAYVLGPKVAAFEKDFAAYAGARHCVGVNSGTSALHLALICAGVGAGDEVITVPMTFIATSWAVSYCGAAPVYVDVDPDTATMDAAQVEKKITKKTKAILPVHLYGQPADMEPLLDISRRHGIPIVEDVAQAHGATYRGRKTGTMGQSGCFSFYPGKNLGAYGEAGAVITDDDAIAARMRALRDHAQEKRYHHNEIGFNYRMDGFQGAVLGIKLKHLERWTISRIRLADRYLELLADLPIRLPVHREDRRHVWHLFVARHRQRDQIREQLEKRGVHTGLHYPIPLHLQKAYHHLGHREGDFPVAERIGRECFTLPLFPEMTSEQQAAVIEALTEVTADLR
jgi:dTDP-4-amino-4,6-dideoxygalactose transaminase